MDNVIDLFSGLEVFRHLRFELIKTEERMGNDSTESKEEYDRFSQAISEFASEHKKIITNSLPLKIGIVGSFSTGKSMLINSLIGAELLGVADEPSTCKITILSYRDVPEPQIYRVSPGCAPVEVTYDEYLHYSVHNHQNGEAINDATYFEIYHPAVALKDFQIFDTPGFSSISKGDDEITKEYLNKVDILLWVFDACRGGILKEELDLLKSNSNKRIIAVINKADALAPSTRERVFKAFSREFEFSQATFYSATCSLNYQKNSQFNNRSFEQMTSKMLELLRHQSSMNTVKSDNSVSITVSGEVIFEAPLMNTDDEEEEVEYHHNLINILRNIRQEITVIKTELFDEQLQAFYDEEEMEWLKLLAALKKVAAETVETFDSFMESLSSLRDEVTGRMEKQYDEFEKGLTDRLYNELYCIVYEAGNRQHGPGYVFQKNNITDNYKAIKEMVNEGFDVFHGRFINELIEGLKELDVDITDNYEIRNINVLKYNFVITSKNSVIASHTIALNELHVESEQETREIVKGKLGVLVSHKEFKDVAIFIIMQMVIRLMEEKEAELNRKYPILENLINTISSTLHE